MEANCFQFYAIANLDKTSLMIKIIIYINIAFFYRKANILHRWSNILCQFYWNKGVCHCCRSQ